MSITGTHKPFRYAVAALFVLTVAGGINQSVIAQDAGAPPWGEFLRRFNKDPLLKKPFHMDPEEGVKGLASKIRARELDIPNRKRAIRYLADQDCRQFPEAKEMLLGMLDPEVEKWEEVRFVAATGLRDMLTRHSCNPQTAAGNGRQGSGKNGSANSNGTYGSHGGQCNSCGQNPGLWQQCRQTASNYSKKLRREKASPEDTEPPCHCRSCCDADTLNILARTAYELKEDGCCYEPSRRVREMAVEAIKACGVPCNYEPYYAKDGEPGPPPIDESGPRSNQGGEVIPPPTNEIAPPPSPGDNVQDIRFPAKPSLTSAPTPISRLSSMCIVSLHNGRQVPSQQEFSATFRGRVYYFASLEALRKFQASPELYAVAFGGCDPVHYVETREAVEGRYLAQYKDKFYMFATKQNHERFVANPARYIVNSDNSSTVTVSR